MAAAALAAGSGRAVAGGHVRTAASVVESLRGSTPVFLPEGVTIVGDLDLRDLRVVAVPFRCRGCILDGALVATAVTFKGPLDLSGTKITGAVDFRDATFESPVVFGAKLGEEARGAKFEKRVDFTLASFDALVSFQTTTFARAARFQLARFRADSVFSDAMFQADLDFEAAGFAGAAHFDGAGFHGAANFGRTTFQAGADFRAGQFLGTGDATFDRAEFRQDADFGETYFVGIARFFDTRFANDASFVRAGFGQLAYFEGASSSGRLDFERATFEGEAVFKEVTARSLSLARSPLASATLDLTGLTTGDLVLAVDGVDRIPNEGDRVEPLRQVESSAKARGDIGLANDAHYKLRLLESHAESWPLRVLDAIFYRGLAGYFVRPLHPLLAAFGLALTLGIWREFRPRLLPWRRRRSDSRRSERLAPLGRLTARVFDSAAAVRRGGAAEPPDAGAMGRRLEVLAYRLLLVCALIGLANSNPTLRQMFDALL